MKQIRQMHQIEMTSHCNLRCRYCPNRSLQRPKVHMSEEHYVAALTWARVYVSRGWQSSLSIAGIGESTMHPEFVRYCHMAREAVGNGVPITFATNGLLVTDEMIRDIAPMQPNIFVSLHRPEKAGPAIEILKKYGVFRGVSADPSVAAINWAGQVNWHVSVPVRRPCMWLNEGMVIALADGRVSRCPLDASGVGVICTLDDDLDQFETSPYILCKTCDQLVPEDMRGTLDQTSTP